VGLLAESPESSSIDRLRISPLSCDQFTPNVNRT
jgi:hypothetical protein